MVVLVLGGVLVPESGLWYIGRLIVLAIMVAFLFGV